MSLLPASSNHAYRGSPASPWFLGVYGLAEILPGLIHFFFRDGGARSIAGLDLGTLEHVIIGVFAWMGSLQIAYGLAILAVAIWYRPLVPLFLALALLERLLMTVAAWVTKTGPTGHHPPEHYASLLLCPLLAVFLVLAVRHRLAPTTPRPSQASPR